MIGKWMIGKWMDEKYSIGIVPIIETISIKELNGLLKIVCLLVIILTF
jgi:hypothetical protein